MAPKCLSPRHQPLPPPPPPPPILRAKIPISPRHLPPPPSSLPFRYTPFCSRSFTFFHPFSSTRRKKKKRGSENKQGIFPLLLLVRSGAGRLMYGAIRMDGYSGSLPPLSFFSRACFALPPISLLPLLFSCDLLRPSLPPPPSSDRWRRRTSTQRCEIRHFFSSTRSRN